MATKIFSTWPAARRSRSTLADYAFAAAIAVAGGGVDKVAAEIKGAMERGEGVSLGLGAPAAADRYPEAYLRENIATRLKNLGAARLDLLQLHTWTRAWNRNPTPFKILRALQREGLVRHIGVSTPEHDQNSVIDLMRGGWVDSVQVIYNLFEQEPAAELLEVARELGVGIIVRVAFDEGALTGKFTAATTFASGDFRASYFAGDRLPRVVARVGAIQEDLAGSGYTLPQAALKWILAHPAVSTVIPGVRNIAQADANCGVSDLPDMPFALVEKLRRHNWRRGIWYGGK